MVGGSDRIIAIFDGKNPQIEFKLDEMGSDVLTFGRAKGNRIELTSQIVSGTHGHFIRRGGNWYIEDKGAYEREGSTNGIIYNNTQILSKELSDGDIFRIDDAVEAIRDGVLFMYFESDATHKWERVPLAPTITIGRNPSCNIPLTHPGVSGVHAVIRRYPDGNFYITDQSRTNGVVINSRHMTGTVRLHEKDVIMITNTKIIFTSFGLYVCRVRGGISVDAYNISVDRKNSMKAVLTGKAKRHTRTLNNVSLHIRPGELVAIIGGSGAGKSTVMNAISGYLKPSNGEVFINGVNLYEHFDSLKQIIGYVPQQDIVHETLTVREALMYTAKLRLPKDTTAEERKAAVENALKTVDLTEKGDSLVNNLSGGQKKRVSIAVELLSDPNLMFLDEPSSGLDPGTERSLVQSLRKMADNGKTIIMVTHSTLQLEMCDRIVVMGRNGNLCFFGSYREALKFFNVESIIDVYSMVTDHAEYWRDRYNHISADHFRRKQEEQKTQKQKRKRATTMTLAGRYFRTMVRDTGRFVITIGQAPALAILIGVVSQNVEGIMEYMDPTRNFMFLLACCSFWMGMFDTVQEICKERVILKREYMTGQSLTSYLLSKEIVIAVICAIQSLCLAGVFALLVGTPEEGIIFSPFAEMYITSFLSAMAAAAVGFFVSSLAKNPDKAMVAAPLILFLQIAFSGILFDLEGVSKAISALTVCRWSMEGYGSSADLNSMPLQLEVEHGISLGLDPSDFFTCTSEHLWKVWGILVSFVVILFVISRLALIRVRKSE